jgi:hypothetical protein
MCLAGCRKARSFSLSLSIFLSLDLYTSCSIWTLHNSLTPHARTSLDLQPIYHQRPSGDHRSRTEPRRRRVRHSPIIAPRQLSKTWNKTGENPMQNPHPVVEHGRWAPPPSSSTTKLTARSAGSFSSRMHEAPIDLPPKMRLKPTWLARCKLCGQGPVCTIVFKLQSSKSFRAL